MNRVSTPAAVSTPRELSLALVCDALAAAGLLAEEQRRALEVREPILRSRVMRAREGNNSARLAAGRGARPRYRVSAIEIVVEQKPPRADREGEHLDEDLITRCVAQHLGVPYLKLDPLKLDSALVTSTLSRPFARRHVVIPLKLDGPKLQVALADPLDVELLAELRRITGYELEPHMSSKTDILSVITEFYGFRRSVAAAEKDLGGPERGDIGNLEQLFRLKDVEEIEATDQHVINAVEYLIHYALGQRASDIHLEPRREEGRVRVRIDGVLHEIYRVPRRVHAAFVSRLKVMARLDIAERRRPQDGRIKTKQSSREVELRLSTLPTAFGEKVVCRIFDPEVLMQDLSEVGFFQRELLQYESFIGRPNGLVLVTGPTGSGKTTTLYSSLRALSSPEVNITTVEDPIEMVYEDFNQVAVQRAVDLGFADALRTVLRQDPDIIMVGEIRDPETAQMAVQAALTGHLVLSTLHTNDTATSVTRMLDLGVPPFLLSSTLTGVVAQRLVRKVCKSCAARSRLTDDQIASLQITLPEGGPHELPVQVGEGCVTCRGTGLFGRTAVMEVLPVTGAMRKLILRGADSREMMKEARADGMMTLRECAIKKLALGVTSYEEVIRCTAEQAR